MKGPSILRGAGSESHRLLGVWWLLLVLAALVVVFVLGLIVLALWRNGSGRVDESRWIVGGGVILPVVVLAVLAVATIEATADLRTVKANEVRVAVKAVSVLLIKE